MLLYFLKNPPELKTDSKTRWAALGVSHLGLPDKGLTFLGHLFYDYYVKKVANLAALIVLLVAFKRKKVISSNNCLANKVKVKI